MIGQRVRATWFGRRRGGVRGLVASSGVVVLIAVVSLVAGPASGAPSSGPAGLDFYTPASDLVPGPHGSVIWTRPLQGDPGLAGARNQLVLYRSVDLHGQPVAVSGTLSVPQGQPPAGGWPLISWAHGTTGVADACAPSRDTGPGFPARDYTSLVRQTLDRWLAAGYAIAHTDYQGLGTPGPHGYLIGTAEQRAVADMALAAREVEPTIGARWVAMGHSQGGQAAIFADAQASDWAPHLQLLGSVALAPASHVGVGLRLAATATTATFGTAGVAPAIPELTGGAVAFVPLLVRGAQAAADIDPARFLGHAALDLLPHADQGCIAQLRAGNSWGGLSPGTVFSSTADVSDLTRVLDESDPSHLRLTAPLLVLHGRLDTTIAPAASDAMVARLTLAGQPVDYRTYPLADHRSLLAASYLDVLAWVNTRFGR